MDTIARRITFLARKSQSYLGTALQKYGLTAAEQPFFMALQHNQGVTQETLTALVGVDKAATARAVKSLEEKGLVTRVQDPKDRRQNRIYPTAAADGMAGGVQETLLDFNRLLTQGMDRRELETLFASLQKLEENLSRITGGKKTKQGEEHHAAEQ